MKCFFKRNQVYVDFKKYQIFDGADVYVITPCILIGN